MNKLVQADVQYLTQQKPEQMRLILSGMAALMQDIDGKAEAMQSQNWFQRMVKTVTGKNKLTLEEIQRNRDKLNVYMAEAVAELYRLGQVDHSIIMSLGTQINEIYMEHVQLQQTVGAFAVKLNNKIESVSMEQTQLRQMLGAFAATLNGKIESVDNFHMLVAEIDQGVYTGGVTIANICKVLSQFDKRILKEPRKQGIILRALDKQNIIRHKPMTLADYLADVLSVPMDEAGQVYMELGTMRGSLFSFLAMKAMENYHFLPDEVRQVKVIKSLISKIIRDEDLTENIKLSSVDIFIDFLYSKVDVLSRGLLSMTSMNTVSEEELRQNVDLCRSMAEQDNAKAQCILGSCYDKGNGLSVDKARAVYWYRRAAERGYVKAQGFLGLCYYHGNGTNKNKTKAIYWYGKAAEQGHAGIQYLLGCCYDKGDGVNQDKRQAAYWWRKAAEQGYAYAQYRLGDCYWNGDGVEENEEKAAYWWRKAKEQGCTGIESV